MLRIYLFGPPRFERDGVPILVSRRKGVAMLSYLVQIHQPVHRETLAAMFWPELGQAEALKSLRRELSRLRKSFGTDCLGAFSSQLVFDPSAVVDTNRFQQKLALVREHDHFPEEECSSCLEALHEAASHYGQVFMAGFNLRHCPDFDEWQDYQREALQQELGHALYLLTRWYLSRQCEDQAVQYCSRWLALDPLNEGARRLLMLAHAQAGRPAEALRIYEEGARMLQEELGITPTKETRQLSQQIRTGVVPSITQAVSPDIKSPERSALLWRQRSNLPHQSTPFVGRQRELMMIQLRLREPACRLLTLIGPGGIGKTRLALKVGECILEDANPLFGDGVFFVPLASARSSAEIVSAILEAVSVPFYKDKPSTDVLLDSLRDKRLLLIMDNMEHLLKGSEIVSTILENAPGIRVLATSRIALRLQGEWFHPVGGMYCPPRDLQPEHEVQNREDINTLRTYDAVQLFEQCAGTASPDFLLEEELEDVIRICQLVDGMPLALELAAAWIKVMDTGAIADELNRGLDLLASRFRNMPDRHRSIRVVFNQTWVLLSPAEQDALARLSVFRVGFTREAALEVAGADLFLLSGLIEKALLTPTTHGRYRLHELLRQFAFEKLQGMNEVEESRTAHFRYYMSFLAKLEPALKGGQQPQALDQIKTCLENIRLAWHYALERSELKALSGALETIYLYFFISGRNQEGVDFLQPAGLLLAPRKDESPKQLWGRILSRICLLKTHLPPDEGVKAEIRTALAVARQYQDEAEVAYCNFVLGVIHTLIKEDASAAIQASEQALMAFRRLNDSFYLVQVLIWLGFCHGNNSRLDLYYEYNHQALELARTAGHRAGSLNALGNLVAWAFCTGDYATAEQFALEVGREAVELDLPNMVAHSKTQMCLAYFLKGEMQRSEKLSHEAYALALELHLPLSIAYSLTFLALHAVIAGDYLLAKTQAEKSLATPAPRFSMIMAYWALALACCGLRQEEAAWRHVREMLEVARQASFPAMATWPLPVMGVLCARAGNQERAVQLLALAQSHPKSPTGWQDKWPLLGEVLDTLRSELGEKTFDVNWQQGQALHLDVAITETLDCRTDSSPPPYR